MGFMFHYHRDPQLFLCLYSWAPPGVGPPKWRSGKEPTCQCRRHEFDPWVRKIPWRRAWQPTPLFLPGESHGQRSLAGYSPWGHKELDTSEWWTCIYTHKYSFGLSGAQLLKMGGQSLRNVRISFSRFPEHYSFPVVRGPQLQLKLVGQRLHSALRPNVWVIEFKLFHWLG